MGGKSKPLQRIDLHRYAERVREAFGIRDVADSAIDYGFITAVEQVWDAFASSPPPEPEFITRLIKGLELESATAPEQFRGLFDRVVGSLRKTDLEDSDNFANLGEMVRRRILLSYFIPDVFEPGRHDRQLDIIDGCIYFLEREDQQGQPSLVTKYWRKRAGVSAAKKEADFEKSTFGILVYHPVEYVLGRTRSAYTSQIPKIVQWLRIFQGRKRKISLYDYFYWFWTTAGYAQDPSFAIDDTLLRIVIAVQAELEKVPFFGLNLQEFIESQMHLSPTQARRYLAEFRKVFLGIYNQYNRAAFGLPSYVFVCQYPHYVQVFHQGAPMVQNLCVMGASAYQQFWTVIPAEYSWKALYAKFPRATECYEVEWLPVKRQGALEYFDLGLQGWRYDWEKIKEGWKHYFSGLAQESTPTELQYRMQRPSLELLSMCFRLETNALYTNKELVKALKTLPIEEVKAQRIYLERIMTTRLLGMTLFLDQPIEVRLPGQEYWKYQLLLKVGEVIPSTLIRRLTPVHNGDAHLAGVYGLHPLDILPFIHAFEEVFHGALEYTMTQYCNWPRKPTHWYDLFNAETRRWQWSADQFEVRAMNPHAP